MSQAELITRYKQVMADGAIIELVVWRVPATVPPGQHGFKYRAAYVEGGRRVIGFDNERGKGDHMHIGNTEMPYAFTTVEKLTSDFIRAVDRYRSAR